MSIELCVKVLALQGVFLVRHAAPADDGVTGDAETNCLQFVLRLLGHGEHLGELAHVELWPLVLRVLLPQVLDAPNLGDPVLSELGVPLPSDGGADVLHGNLRPCVRFVHGGRFEVHPNDLTFTSSTH